MLLATIFCPVILAYYWLLLAKMVPPDVIKTESALSTGHSQMDIVGFKFKNL